MAKLSKPHEGSLQFWPRKKARKFVPSSNWSAIKDKGILGFITYKVGMSSAIVKDNTSTSMTKGKKIAVPVTILEAPAMKILSVRYYKNNLCVGEELAENLDKELIRIIKLPKTKERKKIGDYDDIRIIVYSQAKKTAIKKTPDICEIGIGGTLEEKKKIVDDYKNKEIAVADIFKNELVDVRGLTKGHGFSGPVKRFGLGLKSHKAEKGRRRPGSLGPWHPHHVIFRVAMAGQLGLFTRVHYNNKIIALGKTSEKNINPPEGWKHFGNIKTDYVIIDGSVQGPAKRQIVLTKPLRRTRHQERKSYELVGLR